MDYGLYVAASGADSQNRRMEVLSHNLANVDTPGFKSEFAVLQARYSRAVQDGTDVQGTRGLNDLSSGVTLAETQTDFSPGSYKKTGAKWDMAIRGDGFFLVEDGANQRQLLTRAGNFEVNALGQLLTPQGYKVLDTQQSPIVIDPLMPSRVHGDGWVEHSGSGQMLALVKPRSLGDLARVGSNTFRSLAPVTSVPQNERKVETGFLENSGVSPPRAMMELIETSRMYEANVKMIQNHDQMTGSLVNRVLSSR
jgi:flagellar basal-body rod protein FlgF/flagellar basal-body rod protein FlgG